MRIANQHEVAELSDELSRLAALAHSGLLAGCRALQPGDEFQLFPCEAGPLIGAIASVRRASGAARLVARTLLTRLGSPTIELARTISGAPQWPTGFVGSMAHDAEFAVAVVAANSSVASVGIDVEPKAPLPAELIQIVATPFELTLLRGDLVSARLLFCIKEAVYKATHPLDGVFLDYHDIEVDLGSMTARTRSGYSLRVFAFRQPRLVALTVLPAE